jgi:protocatechuate 3,4-dioxygenase beta subunit
MQRRTLIIGGGAATALAVASAGYIGFPRSAVGVSMRQYDWKGSDFLSGGTQAIKAALPEPVFRARPNCVATCARILGPCHVESPERHDMSGGIPGLPTRLSLRLVSMPDCRPIAGADVELWHTNAAGIYSGDAANMCNPGDREAKAADFARGRQVTDSDGRVDFLTVYPGWYRTRTVHIHMRAVVGGRELLVSQLLFDDSLSDVIFADHPDYAGRGERRVRNDNDGQFSREEVGDYIFDVEKLDVGVLQGSFTIGVAEDRC